MKDNIIRSSSSRGWVGMRPDTPLCRITDVSAAFKTQLSGAVWAETWKSSRAAGPSTPHPASACTPSLALSKMVHKEFETAGKKPGLQVWRVEKMDIAPVPTSHHGSFYTGDSYIVLYTSKNTPASYIIHAWHGSEASADERGCAAIFMMQLDDFLGSSPVQYCEFQGEESKLFLAHFKKGIRYLKGGIESGFKNVETNESDVKRVFKVKGRRGIRAKEVCCSWDSFNKGDCFIIDLGKQIYLWRGSKSNMYERLKITELASEIRDAERQGRATLEQVDEGSEPKEVTDVLGQKPDTIAEADCEDLTVDAKNTNIASLYLISDVTGSMKITKKADKNPFKQDCLSSSDCYILDNGKDKRVFVWKGSNASKAERKAALTAAQKFIKDKNYHPDTMIIILPDGAEPMMFKQFFDNWQDKDETKGLGEAYCVGKIAKVKQIPFDASTLHSNKLMAAQHGMVDDGSGKVQIWRVEKGDKVPVDPSTYGQFFGGDCYLVLYSYNTGGREKHIIYMWQGLKCSKDELGGSAVLTVNLDDSMGGVATQVRVTQGQEPAHLVSLFKDKPLVIHSGGTCRDHGQSAPASKRLFHIRHSSTNATRAVEVEPVASSLNTNDMFVLKSDDKKYIWKGNGSTPKELEAAKYVVDVLGGSAQEVEETKEPADFWAALGGKKKYQTSKALQNTIRPPRLFGCSNKTGRLIADEVPGEFTQKDLLPDDVMILDAWEQLYLWIGKEANKQEKEGAEKIAKDYLKSDPSGRVGTPICMIKQGEEPPCFTGWFLAWDDEMWDKEFSLGMKHSHDDH
ncbi:scinderin like a [Halichoeres trimaculatus]|uniref:scinderin like a n=1 Tax=Halichoeres trimaculatus TaxID=147232 RepID=UPI003D9F5856